MIQILQTLPEIEPINVTDSLKVVKETVVTQLQNDPQAFFQDLLDKFIQFGFKLLAAIVLFAVGAWIISRLRILLRRRFKKFDGTISSFIISCITALLYIILIILSISTLGINTTSLAALLAAGGMAIGMALSGTVQNFAGGIILMIFKPFKTGDFITAQGYSGTVTDMSIVNTRIRTVDNKIIVIPNNSLSSGNIENYSALPLRRVDWIISVEYNSDARECIKAIKEILSRDGRILDSGTKDAEDLFVGLNTLNDNDIGFIVKAWVKTSDYWDVYYDGLQMMYTHLPEYGFGFAYPHLDVSIQDSRKDPEN